MNNNYWITQFEHALRNRGLQDKTIRSYLLDLEQFLIWAMETKNITNPTQVSTHTAREYLNHLLSPVHELRPGQKGSYKHSTVERKIKVLKSFYDFFMETQ